MSEKQAKWTIEDDTEIFDERGRRIGDFCAGCETTNEEDAANAKLASKAPEMLSIIRTVHSGMAHKLLNEDDRGVFAQVSELLSQFPERELARVDLSALKDTIISNIDAYANSRSRDADWLKASVRAAFLSAKLGVVL